MGSWDSGLTGIEEARCSHHLPKARGCTPMMQPRVQKEFRYVLHVDLAELGLDAGEGDEEHA